MKTATRYRAGLIGCGAMSRHHAPALQAIPLVELVALSDIDKGRLHQAGATYGVSALYREFEHMLANESLDLVVICTQAPVHCEATVAAAEAGVRGVLCEKPMALDLAQADRMVDTCCQRNVKLAINHPFRLSPAVFRALALVQEGVIGELLTIRMMDKGGRPAGNSLMEIATHLFDCARVFAGDVAWTCAALTVSDEDGGGVRLATRSDIMPSRAAWPRDRDCGLVLGERCSAIFGFHPYGATHSRGVQATYQTFFQPPEHRWVTGLELVGLEGTLALRSTGDGVLDLFLHRGPWEPAGRFEPVLTGEATRHPSPGGTQNPALPQFTAGLLMMLQELVSAIENGREHRSSGFEGRAALEMIMSVYESHRRGATVMLPLRERAHPLRRWLDDADSLNG